MLPRTASATPGSSGSHCTSRAPSVACARPTATARATRAAPAPTPRCGRRPARTHSRTASAGR
eukprot:3426492-Rhodomonas_salina.1